MDLTQNLTHLIKGLQGILRGHHLATDETVLHETNQNGIALRTDDLMRRRHDFLRFGNGAVRLQGVNIHFICGVKKDGRRIGNFCGGESLCRRNLTWQQSRLFKKSSLKSQESEKPRITSIEIRVKRPCDCERQTKRETLDAIRLKGHHRSFPERRLTIEENPVSILQMALDDKAGTNLRCEINACFEVKNRKPNDVIGIRARRPYCKGSIGRKGSADDALCKRCRIPRRDIFRKRKLVHDAVGHSEFVNVVRGIRTDDGAPRLVDALAGKIATQTTFFARQACLHVDNLALVRRVDDGQEAHARRNCFLDRVINETGRHDLKFVVQVVVFDHFRFGHAFQRSLGAIAKFKRTFLLETLKFEVRAYNVLEGLGQIIFRTDFGFARKIRRTNAGRRHNLQRHQKIPWLDIGRKSKDVHCLGRNGIQNCERFIGQKTFLDKGLKFGRLL